MKKSLTISPKMSPQATIRQKKGALAHFQGRHSLSLEKNVSFTFNVTHSNTNYQDKVHCGQRYTYRVLQTIQIKLILLCVLAEQAVLGSTKTALKFKYEI